MDGIYILVGLISMYSTVHFFVLSFKNKYADRTTYEKVVSITAIVCIALTYIGIMFE